jgi:subtilisin family serine protease
LIGGTPEPDIDYRNHGTSVLGEFSGDRNGFGVTGISPNANVRTVSYQGGLGIAAALRTAADALSAGDILLIELHYPGPRFGFLSPAGQRGYIPVEWWPDNLDAIRYATAKGIVVVEAGGNGSESLDDPLYDQNPQAPPFGPFPSSWRNPFRRNPVDSLAILVGAGAPPPGTHGRDWGPDRSRLDFSNYGLLMDVQAWGREVTSTGGGDLQGGSDENLWYTDTFAGTSSASPIVVGALACVQGALRAADQPLLTPVSARALLRAGGSAQQDGPGRPTPQRIGTRPDLRQMIQQLMGQPVGAEH